MLAAKDTSPKIKIQEYTKKSWCSFLAARFHAFREEKKGVAAIEFAYILPFMAIIWVGMTVVLELINANRKVSLLVYSIGDMTSQLKIINQAELDTIFQASSNTLWPFKTSSISLRITSYWSNKDGKAYVRWSAVPSNTKLSGEYAKKEKCEKTDSINDKLILKNSEIFLVEARVKYTASIGGVIANQIFGDTFTNGESAILEFAYIRPRTVGLQSNLPALCMSDPYAYNLS